MGSDAHFAGLAGIGRAKATDSLAGAVPIPRRGAMTERHLAVPLVRRLRSAPPTTIAFLVLLLVGLALRIYFVQSTAYTFNSDNAVVYLMARHVAHGEISAFYWGQFYGGTGLQIVAGLVMLVVGQSILALAVVSALFWGAAAWVLRSIVGRAAGTTAGDLAGVLFWFPGATILGTSVADPGFYGPSILIGMLGIWWSLRRPLLRPWWSWLVLGVLAGLALWTSPVAIAFVAPAVVYAAMKDRRWRLWLLFVASALVAAAAWIWGTVIGHLSSIKPLGGASLHPESLASIFTDMFPAAFPGGRTELGGFLIALATIAGISGLVIIGVRRRNPAIVLLGASTVFVVGVLILGTGVRLAADSVRYSGYLMPGLATMVALLAVRVKRLPVVVGAIAVVLTIGLVGQQSNGFRLRSGPPIDSNLVAVGRMLDAKGIHAAYGSYWAAYALSAATDERITVASLIPRRYAPYERAAAHHSPEAIIVFEGGENDTMLQSEASVPAHHRTVVGGYAVYVFDHWFDPLPLVWVTF